MEETRETYIDKSKWADGPWKDEPDRIEWRFLDMPCLIVRGPSGALCGYVAVAPGHPWHGVEYGAIDPSPAVHWGLTYSDRCQAGGKICHVAREGEADDVWWVGFDCAHSGDISPSYLHLPYLQHIGFDGVYRDEAYVRSEVECLAAQAKEAA